MVYMVDLSEDLENNEIFLFLKNLLLQMKEHSKNDTEKGSKEDVHKALLFLLKNMFKNGMGDIENEELKQSIALILREEEKPPDKPQA